MSTTRILVQACAALIVACLAPTAQAQFASQFLVMDFEALPEGTEISDQYLDQGAVFLINGNPAALPIIAVEDSNERISGTTIEPSPMSGLEVTSIQTPCAGAQGEVFEMTQAVFPGEPRPATRRMPPGRMGPSPVYVVACAVFGASSCSSNR